MISGELEPVAISDAESVLCVVRLLTYLFLALFRSMDMVLFV